MPRAECCTCIHRVQRMGRMFESLTGNLKVVFNVKSDTDMLHTIESICSSLR